MLEVVKVLVPVMVGVIGMFVPAYKLYLENKQLKAKNVELNDKIEDLSLSLQLDLQTFNDIKSVAENILHNTKGDRFLILTATNGVRDMRFATAVYEHHKKSPKITLSLGATGKYVKFEFDSAYKQMLKDAENLGALDIDVENMSDCDLKAIYRNEDIKHSRINFLFRAKIDDRNDRLFYSSVATHDDKRFTQGEKVIIKQNIDKLKFLLKDLSNEKNN